MKIVQTTIHSHAAIFPLTRRRSGLSLLPALLCLLLYFCFAAQITQAAQATAESSSADADKSAGSETAGNKAENSAPASGSAANPADPAQAKNPASTTHMLWSDNDSPQLSCWSQINIPKSKSALQAQTGGDFTVVRRGEFLIASDLDEQRFDYLINGVFACCREIMGREFFDKKPQQIITVYVFKDQKSYTGGLKKIFGLDPISPYGHYGHKKRYIVVNYATGPGTLVHEMTHALMAEDFPAAPIWISEGMASLYEQCRVENNSIRGEQNWRLPELKKILDQGKLSPLPALFGSDTKVFRMMQESLNYAQSRYFCLYMEEKGLLRKLYAAFRDTAESDPTGIKAVEAVFDQDITEIERDWLEWLKNQSWKKPE